MTKHCASRQSLAILNKGASPIYFGPQRFGYRNDSTCLAQHLSKTTSRRFTNAVGQTELDTQEDFIKAPKLYEEGRLEEAFYMWHSAFGDYRRALKSLMRTNGNLKKAFRDFDHRLIGLFIAAWQSDLFNKTLARRMPDIDVLLKGDMAYKHENGASFRVENRRSNSLAATLCDHPTGPLLAAG